MRISIVIPVYNVCAFIREAIDSGLAQKRYAEVIIIDDGSTDGSGDIIRSYGSAVKAHFGPNLGVSAARNLGFSLSRGDYIQFLDSDDILTPGALLARLEMAESSKADVVYSPYRKLIQAASGAYEPAELGRLDDDALSGDAQLACATSFWAPPAALLYKRAIVERIGGFREDLPIIQDARFLFDAARHGASFAKCAHVGALYRIAPNSLSRHPERFARDLLTNARQIEELWTLDGALHGRRAEALADMYDLAARGLLEAASSQYMEAVRRQAALGLPLSKHATFMGPLARTLGVVAARWVHSVLKKVV